MFRKTALLLFSFLFVILIKGPAWSSVEGAWDVSGEMTVKVKMTGYGVERETSYFEDEFIFHDDGSFEMIDLEGSWSQQGRKFFVYADPADIEDYFEVGLGDALDADVDVNLISYSFTGKGNKPSTRITGKFKMKMYFYVDEYDLEGTVNMVSTFTGYRSSGYFPARKTRLEDRAPAWVIDSIEKAIEKALQVQ
ncbi:MAG: hypothetical protein AB1442_05410 [Nitrospirota bacterium]